MLILLGKTGSGKDTVVNRLISDYGYKKIVVYTTRPKRKGEVNDVTYHFITEEEFKNKIDYNFFLEYKTYKTVNRVWYYGSSKEDYIKADSKTVIILTPSGYRDFIEKIDIPYTSIYLYANNTTIKSRLKDRGDNVKESERRLYNDNKDFKNVENIVNKIIYNNSNNKLEDVIHNIIKYLEV